MSPTHDDAKQLVGSDPETLTRDCRQLRRFGRTNLPCADDIIAFLDGYNAFINHATRPFSPMREVKLLL